MLPLCLVDNFVRLPTVGGFLRRLARVRPFENYNLTIVASV